jgi:hypothetical protein
MDVVDLIINQSKSLVSRRGALGFICRDDKCMFWELHLLVSDGIADPSMLGGHACREALVQAGDLKLQRVKVASYYLSGVNKINSGMSHRQHCIISRDTIQHTLIRASFQETSYGHEW